MLKRFWKGVLTAKAERPPSFTRALLICDMKVEDLAGVEPKTEARWPLKDIIP